MEGPVIITHTWVFPPLFLPLVGLCDTLTGGKAPEAFTIPWMCYGGPTFTFLFASEIYTIKKLPGFLSTGPEKQYIPFLSGKDRCNRYSNEIGRASCRERV